MHRWLTAKSLMWTTGGLLALRTVQLCFDVANEPGGLIRAILVLKVLLDAEGSGNMIYLPIDKLLEGRGGSGGSAPGRSGVDGTSSSANAAAARRQADDARARRSR